MITPQPESDLSLNTLSLGADIIKLLKQNGGVMIVEDLLNSFLAKDNRRNFSKFFEVITFLYTIGFISEQGYKIRLLNGYTQTNLF